MSNQIQVVANIIPPGAPMEASIDGGSTFRPVLMATVGHQQQGLISNVPAGTYPAGALVLGVIGYPASRIANLLAVNVANIYQDVYATY